MKILTVVPRLTVIHNTNELLHIQIGFNMSQWSYMCVLAAGVLSLFLFVISHRFYGQNNTCTS